MMEDVMEPTRIVPGAEPTGTSAEPSSTSCVVRGRTLDGLVRHAPRIDGVWSRDVEPGDWVVVRTKNSTYSLFSLGDGQFRVAGGWFTAHGFDNLRIRIAGCTWGGCAIHTGLVAAPGMWLEFGNGVRTTCIREVRLLRQHDNRTH
jgi:hypothetical protein